MTLLDLVKQACRELAVQIPNAVATSTAEQDQQMYGLMNALGQELISLDHDWQALIEETTFVTDGTGIASLPNDFYRQLESTTWDRTNRWQLAGPILPDGWQWLKSSSLAPTAPVARYRIRGNALEYFPSTNSGNTFAYEYLRKTWAIDGDNQSEKEAFSKDTDVCVFRDRLMINGLKMKFLEAKGFDARLATRDFGIVLESAMAEGGAPVLSVTPQQSSIHLLDYSNIPDSGYG